MTKLRWFGLVTGLLVVLGQVARFRLDVFSDVRPWDDIAAGALLVLMSLRLGSPPAHLAAAWALITGVHLTTLVINLHEWLAGGKAGGPFYVVLLSAITLAGTAATVAAARRS